MEIMKSLNQNEEVIYNECKILSEERGDTGAEFTFDNLCYSFKGVYTINQLKGYMGVFVEKGLIEPIGEGCYFDFYVKELM